MTTGGSANVGQLKWSLGSLHPVVYFILKSMKPIRNDFYHVVYLQLNVKNRSLEVREGLTLLGVEALKSARGGESVETLLWDHQVKTSLELFRESYRNGPCHLIC